MKKGIAFIMCAMCLVMSAGVNAADAVTIEVVELSEKAPNKPIAINLDVKTYRGVTTGGEMHAYPQSEECSFQITSQPKHGTVTFHENGSFVYTHDGSRTKKDSFSYAVTENGVTSNEAKVSIKIMKQKDKSVYGDMTGSENEYYAMFLKEAGAFTGEKFGSEYVFLPDAPVTAHEFAVMCTAVTGSADLSDTIDDGTITVGKAAEILDGILKITDVEPAFSENESSIDEIQAASNLCACGAISYSDISGFSEILTRANAAKLLAGAWNVLENRA